MHILLLAADLDQLGDVSTALSNNNDRGTQCAAAMALPTKECKDDGCYEMTRIYIFCRRVRTLSSIVIASENLRLLGMMSPSS